MVVEIAASSHEVDRGVKARLYSGAGVPVYWLVDVPRRAVEVYTTPTPDGYVEIASYGLGATVPSPAAGVGAFAVASLVR